MSGASTRAARRAHDAKIAMTAIAERRKFAARMAEIWDGGLSTSLVAAAPEMLAALKAIVEDYEWSEGPRPKYSERHPVTAAKRAIQKAEGR